LACIVAVMLEPCLRGGIPGRLLYKILPVCLSTLGLIWGPLLVVYGAWLHSDLAVAGIVYLLAASALFVMTHRSPALTTVAVAGFLLVLFTAHELFTRSVFVVSPAFAWLETIRREDIDTQNTPIGTVGIRARLVGQARLLSNGRLHFRELSDDVAAMELSHYPVLIVSEAFSSHLSGAGFALTRSGFVYRDFTSADIRRLLTSEDRRIHLSSLQTPFYLAVRKAP
jgi:hypothetical protein